MCPVPSLTVENYLKAILQLENELESEWVSTGALAGKLDLSPGTVTSMLKTLSDSALAAYKPYEGVALTDAGRTLALRMLRRHRLLELFLVHTLNLTWDQVHEEAEHMEHAVSDFLIDRIDEFLDHPETDPHGAPIPTSEGVMRAGHDNSVPLSTCERGTHVRLIRVVNQEPEFLRYLAESGFQLGVEGVVTGNAAEIGVVTVEVNDQTMSVGLEAAQAIYVERISSAAHVN